MFFMLTSRGQIWPLTVQNMDTSDDYWMSGTYLELTQAGIHGILMFATGYLWIVLSPNGFVASGDMQLGQAAIMGAMVASHGCLLALILGVIFDVIPLVYGSENVSIPPSSLKAIYNLNQIGTAIILVGIIIGDLNLFHDLYLVGMAAFAFQYTYLFGMARSLVMIQNKNKDRELAPALKITAALVPLPVLTCLITGLYSENIEIVRTMMWITISFQGIPIVWCLLTSHLHRRFDWMLFSSPNGIRNASFVVILVSISHGIFEIISFFDIYDSILTLNIARSIPLICMGIMLKPWILIRNVFKEKIYVALVVQGAIAILILGICNLLVIYSDPSDSKTWNSEGAGTLFIFTILSTISLGYLACLHEDHLHTLMENRIKGWPTALIAASAMVIITLTWFQFEIFYNIPVVIRGIIVGLPFILTGFRMITWWRNQVIPEQGEWKRIPMFYDEINEPLDPYDFS